ncbi:6265_t:CDS:2 [Funneliformis mosseae]|uniref:6265_t:CDS:1 n=1 Tax=Funneliformis mosseae TaxID=27381 RepID=A0A9N9DVI8_FUNMO|nr:6265_t:CDS:2 [Funneliformis mosseae]
MWRNDIRVVVGIDFGTTYSGFTYSHLSDENEKVHINEQWHGMKGKFKTNTTLQYDDELKNVVLWGNPALCKKPSRRNNNEKKPVELFKLHLGNCLNKPELTVPYKKAITDYLDELGKLIEETVTKKWTYIDFMKNVLLVVTVPAEYSENDKLTMRECIFNAGLIENLSSEKLQFTTEPEAAAIYCMNDCLKEHNLTAPGTIFMIADCGGGTVDLTTRKLLGENQLGEVTERAGDFCGSTFIDKEFVNLLKREVGSSAVTLFEKKHYGQMQHLIQDFCRRAKLPFSDDNPNFIYELDFEELAPSLKQYVTGREKNSLEKINWMIEIDFGRMKSMFDPIVNRIVEMIDTQLNNSSGKCSAIFLVGGFSQSNYLQKAIKDKFSHKVENISVPTRPIAAVVYGAALYGRSLNDVEDLTDLSKSKRIIVTRVLNRTFGVLVSPKWKLGDPPDRMTIGGRIDKFCLLAKRGTEVTINEKFTETMVPVFSFQTNICFEIYYTTKSEAVYCDEPGMKLLGKLLIELPDVELGTYRPVTFNLSFGAIEVKASAYNKTNGQNYESVFQLNERFSDPLDDNE